MSQDGPGAARGPQALTREFNRAAGGDNPPPPGLAAARERGGVNGPPPIGPHFQKAAQMSKEADSGRQEANDGSRDKPVPKLDREPGLHLKKAGAEYDRVSGQVSQQRLRPPGMGR